MDKLTEGREHVEEWNVKDVEKMTQLANSTREHEVVCEALRKMEAERNELTSQLAQTG